MLTNLNVSDIKKMVEDKSTYDFHIDEDHVLSIINDETEKDKVIEEEYENNALKYYDLDECSIRVRFWAYSDNMEDKIKNTPPVEYPAYNLGENKIVLTQEQIANDNMDESTIIFDGRLHTVENNSNNSISIIFNPFWKDYDCLKFQFFISAPRYEYQGFPSRWHEGELGNKILFYRDIKEIGFYYKFVLGQQILGPMGVYLIDVLDPSGNIMFGKRIDKTGWYLEHESVIIDTNGTESMLPFCRIENQKAYIPASTPVDIWTMGKPDYYCGDLLKTHIPRIEMNDVFGDYLLTLVIQTDHDKQLFTVLNNYKSPDLNHDLSSMLFFDHDLVPWADIIAKDKYVFVKSSYYKMLEQRTIGRELNGTAYSEYEQNIPYDFDCLPNNCRRNWGRKARWYSLLCDAMWNRNQNIQFSGCPKLNREHLHYHVENENLYYSKQYLNLITYY